VINRLVVSDTSPIRVLSHLSYLHLIGEFFDEVLIPPAVARELESPESHTESVKCYPAMEASP
jgi:predicted nucleic acid-binding protein